MGQQPSSTTGNSEIEETIEEGVKLFELQLLQLEAIHDVDQHHPCRANPRHDGEAHHVSLLMKKTLAKQ
jgi:hypothetical protein